MIDEILNIRHVRKSFSYGIALDDINLDVVTAELAYNVPANTEKAALYLTNTSNPEGDSFLVTASSIQ